MRRKRQLALVLASTLLVAGLNASHATASVVSDPSSTATEAYIRFLPRLYTYISESVFTSVKTPLSRPSAPINQIGYRRGLVTSDTLFIVRPNNDTVYGVGFLDLSREPFVLRVPDTGRLFWSIQLTDPWTEVMPAIGSHGGSPAGSYAIVGPRWRGALPAGMYRVTANADRMNLVLRVGYAMAADPAKQAANIAEAVEILHRFTGAPLSHFLLHGLPFQAPFAEEGPPLDESVRDEVARLVHDDPMMLMQGFVAAVEDPATPLTRRDLELLARLKACLRESGANSQVSSEIIAGIREARRLIDERIVAARPGDNGWVTIPTGNWGNRFLDRAAIAEWAIYANRSAVSLYPETHVDDSGQLLNGGKRYEIRFENGQVPAVEDFWSITMYRGDTLTLAPNPIGRYSIGSHTPGLKYGGDGSLTLYIQKDSPGSEAESNWLPAPEGDFNLMVRLYGPIHGAVYKLPPVRQR